MKKILLVLSVLVLTVFSCADLADSVVGDTGTGESPSSVSITEEDASSASIARSEAVPPVPKELPYSGDGGKNISVAILSPAGGGLSDEEAYLPALVQGVLVSDFTKYSAMSVFDRENLDRLLNETENPYYPESADVARIGRIVPSQYMLTGALSKAGAGYMLKLSVSDSKTTETKWAYSGTVSRAALDNLWGIKAASGELLTQMGVTLTEAGKQALGREDRRVLDAETALARGVSAQREGSTVAAFSFYNEAASYAAGLPEADTRLAALTTVIEGGNIGENVRNEIQRAQAWHKLLDEAIEFYTKYPVVDIVYNPTPQQGNINVQNETFDVLWDMWLEPNARFDAMMKIGRTARGTGKMLEWGLDYKLAILFHDLGVKYDEYDFSVRAELTDEAGNYLGEAKVGPVIEYGGGNTYAGRNPRNQFEEPVRISQSGLGVTVDANLVSGEMKLVFVEAGIRPGNVLGWEEPIFNAIKNMRIIATDKSFNDYFRGRRTYKEYSDGLYYSNWGKFL